MASLFATKNVHPDLHPVMLEHLKIIESVTHQKNELKLAIVERIFEIKDRLPIIDGQRVIDLPVDGAFVELILRELGFEHLREKFIWRKILEREIRIEGDQVFCGSE